MPRLLTFKIPGHCAAAPMSRSPIVLNACCPAVILPVELIDNDRVIGGINTPRCACGGIALIGGFVRGALCALHQLHTAKAAER